jgi:class 3 adenylate cyclase
VLVHLSGVNPTLVNGEPVEGEVPLGDGDTIQLADRLLLRLRLDARAPEPRAVEAASEPAPAADLRVELEAKIERDRAIEERFGVEGSFLDIDVVDSYGMKTEARRPEHIIVSFERFRAFVERVVTQHDGLVLNSNGDELMCSFDDTASAVRAGWEILERRATFNAEENLLARDFSFRLGVHSGRSLVDFERGVAYSAILDLAGHLQKHAEENGLVVSAETLARLPDGAPFELAGRLERDDVEFHRMTGALESGPAV